MKKFKSLILPIFLFMTSLCFSNTLFKPGTYVGSAQGYGGPIKVEVKTTDSKILSLDILEQKETKGISDFALKSIPKEIIENQTLGVDTVAGATFTSNAIIEATKNALKNSGVNFEKISKKIVKDTKTEIPLSDKEADVIIIGAGGAGLAAGVSAYENGAKSVIILEKMPIIGGNTIRSGGAMNAVNPEKQKKQGIEDSIEKHTTQTWEGGNKVANKKLVETMTSNALDGVKWLENYGLKWKKEIGSVIGSVWPRTNQAEDILGTGYINTLEKAFSKYGGKIFLETKAVKLIEKDGKVIGVVATDKNGKDIEFIGKKGVIIATGGYAANFDMVKEYLDDGVYQKENLPKTLENTNHPGATGDGIKMAKDVNAQLVDMKHVQLLPMPADRFGPTINVDNVIFINKDGNRYVKEDGRRDEICLATFAQKDGQYYMINDSQIIPSDRKTTSGQDLDELIKKGTVIEAPTLAQLAKEIGIPEDVLVKTINEFNQAVEKKSDNLGRQIWGNKIEKGPFYATLRFPALHHTMGGVKINEKAQVIDKNNAPITGLYAAGEVTGGIHGANRLGGNAITDIIVFGRIAGENIMKQ